MCGRYSFFETEQLYERFHVGRGDEKLASRYNVAPGSAMPVITEAQSKRVTVLRWGLTPPWQKEQKGRGVINARSETLAEKPMFRKLLASNRCLIPANGWFEWKRTDGRKQPFFIQQRTGGLFAFAGLHDEDDFAIITTSALPTLADVHDRMPLVLRPEYESLWLNPDVTEVQQLAPALVPLPEKNIALHPVSHAVNRASSDGKNLIEPDR
jgi:putative SOS response-associated peptidase YedK